MQCSLKEGLMKDNVSRRRKWKIAYKEERNVTERFIYGEAVCHQELKDATNINIYIIYILYILYKFS